MALLQQLASATRPAASASNATNAAPTTPGPSFVARDERTGETYIRLPMPSPEVVEQVAQGFGALLQGLRK